MRTSRAICMSKVRHNNAPKMILGACWGARARDRSPFLAKPVMKHKITDYYPKYYLLTLNRMSYFLTHFVPMFPLSIFMWSEHQVLNHFMPMFPSIPMLSSILQLSSKRIKINLQFSNMWQNILTSIKVSRNIRDFGVETVIKSRGYFP